MIICRKFVDFLRLRDRIYNAQNTVNAFSKVNGNFVKHEKKYVYLQLGTYVQFVGIHKGIQTFVAIVYNKT